MKSSCWRLGQTMENPSGSQRVKGKFELVNATYRSKEKKDWIMENKKKLKGTKFYVDNDLTFIKKRNFGR